MLNWCNQWLNWKEFKDWRLIESQIEEYQNQGSKYKRHMSLRIEINR